MILSSDGSTTLLLDALIGEKLSVGVDHQQRVPAARLERIGCHILGVAPEALVVDRQSRILNTNNDVISVNHVVIAGRDRDKLVPPPGELLGPYLKRAGLPLKREPLAVSHETWPLGSTSPECVCKEYIIDCGDAGRVYIHEKFNPRFVPPKKDGS